MKSLNDLQWYDANGNLVQSYDKSAETGPAVLFFPAAGSKPIVLAPPQHGNDTTKEYILTYKYDSVEDKWVLAWVEVTADAE